MMGSKTFTRKGVYHLDLEDRIPADHLLRRVTEVVDFSFVRRQTARFYSHTGRPGIDPVVLVKLALLGYLYGITSERRLAAEVRLNLACLWFLGYDLDEPTPDHSVLSKARRRFGVTIYQAFFTEIVRQCRAAGLIAGDQLFADSTLVEANASLESVGSRALLEQLAAPEEYVGALWRDNPAPAEPAPAGPAPAEPAASPAAAGPPGPHRVGPDDPPNGHQGPVNVLAASRTDPDAGLVSRPTVPLGLYHKVHVGVDGGRGRIITAIEVTAGELADEHLLGRLCREHQGVTGDRLAEVVADTKYGTIANYQWLEAQGIRASIPPHENAWADRAVPRELFVYDPVADRYRCPNGQPLTRQGTSRTAHPMGATIYRASPKICGACAHKTACCGDAKARTLTRPNDGGLAERVRAHLATRHAKRSLRRRLSWAETPMAELKERHGCRRAQQRGRDQMRIQALGAAMAYNIKKLAQAYRPQPQPITLARRAGASASGGTPELLGRHLHRPRHPANARRRPSKRARSGSHGLPPVQRLSWCGHRFSQFGNRPPGSI